MSGRTIPRFVLVGLLAVACAVPIGAQYPTYPATGTGYPYVPGPAFQSYAASAKPMPGKLAGTWYRQFEGGVVAATFNDDELKMCATLNADGTLIRLTFTADYTLTKDGLVHGAISGVDWDIKHPGATEPKQPFPTPPDSIRPAEYPLVFKDGPKKGKEVVVALFVSSSPGIGPMFAGSEGKIASEIAEKLPQMAKESKQKLVVLDPALVNKFKMNTPNWKLMHASEWGKKLGADFVLDIHLDKMSLYQPGSLNQLYEGQADIVVEVYDVDAGPGESQFNYVQPFKYPHTGVLDATTIPLNRFKQDYLEHLAAELAIKHIDHKPWSVIVDEPPSETPPSLPIDLSDADVISALHALVDCPFSFRTRSTSAGLMVSNIKLATDDESFGKTAKLFGGMYTFCKDGNIPTPKPAKTTTTYGGMTLPSPRYLEHYPQYFPPDSSHPHPRELASMEDPEGTARRAGLPASNTPPTMPTPESPKYLLPDTAPYRRELASMEDPEGTARRAGLPASNTPPQMTTPVPPNVPQSPQPRGIQPTPPDITPTVPLYPPATEPVQQTAGTVQAVAQPPATPLPVAVAKPGIMGTWYREFGSKLQIIKITPDYLTMTVIMSGELKDGKIATATCVTTADYHITRDGMTLVGLITGVDAQIEGDVPEEDMKDLGKAIEKERKIKEDRPFALTFRIYGDSLVIRNVRMPEAREGDEDNPLQTTFGGAYKNAGDKPLPKPKVTKASPPTSALPGVPTLPVAPISPSNTTPPSGVFSLQPRSIRILLPWLQSVANLDAWPAVGPRVGMVPPDPLPNAYDLLPSATSSSEKKVPATEISVSWKNQIQYLPDSTRNGELGAVLLGQLFLYGSKFEAATAGGTLTVDLVDETPRPTGQPAPARERWILTKETLDKLAITDERFGKCYALGLPWPTYMSGVTRVRIIVRFEPKNGSPLDAPATMMDIVTGPKVCSLDVGSSAGLTPASPVDPQKSDTKEKKQPSLFPAPKIKLVPESKPTPERIHGGIIRQVPRQPDTMPVADATLP